MSRVETKLHYANWWDTVSQAIKAALNDVYTRHGKCGHGLLKDQPTRIEGTRANLRNVNFTRTSSHGDANLPSSARQNPVQIREKNVSRVKTKKLEFLERKNYFSR